MTLGTLFQLVLGLALGCHIFRGISVFYRYHIVKVKGIPYVETTLELTDSDLKRKFMELPIIYKYLNSKLRKRLFIVFWVFGILLALACGALLIYLRHTEYGAWLDIIV